MEEHTITLSDDEIGQLLEGIEVLIEQWENTEQYLRNGTFREDVCIRESHKSSEAQAIAATYRKLHSSIREQYQLHMHDEQDRR